MAMGTIEYRVVQEKGPAHNREFVSHVSLNGEELGVRDREVQKRSRTACRTNGVGKTKSKDRPVT